MVTQSVNLSAEDLQTRQKIYEVAILLFTNERYDDIDMEDIAVACNMQVDAIYSCFTRKEDITMCWYAEHLARLVGYMESQPTGQLTDRYNAVLEETLAVLSPYRSALMDLFGRAMRPDSHLSLMGTDNNPLSIQLSEGYHQLVLASDDALRDPKAEHLGVVLYTFHMLVVLFWLYDRSPDQLATDKLRHFVYDLFKILRPLFMFPMIPKAIAKLAQIVLPSSSTNPSSAVNG